MSKKRDENSHHWSLWKTNVDIFKVINEREKDQINAKGGKWFVDEQFGSFFRISFSEGFNFVKSVARKHTARPNFVYSKMNFRGRHKYITKYVSINDAEVRTIIRWCSCIIEKKIMGTNDSAGKSRECPV